jgi:hypothetical protein
VPDQIPTQPTAPPAWGQPPPQFRPAGPPSPPPPTGPLRPWHRRGWVLFLAGGLVGLLTGVAIGSSGNNPDRASTAATNRPAATAAAPTPTDAPETTAAARPTPQDFELTVKTLSKQCFGSAGCNLTYRIEVGYDGPPLDPSDTYEVVYEVRGGEDGPQINTLTVEGDQSSVDREESISTSTAGKQLTAHATSVDLRS